MTINPAIAHITHADGTEFQVINEAGDDWDCEATAALYQEYLTSLETP